MAHPIVEKYVEDNYDFNLHDDWWDCCYYDFGKACEFLGVDLANNEPCFSGFCSQGDGASFTGSYRSGQADEAVEKIREYFPKDKELIRIAEDLKILSADTPTFWARIYRMGSHYYHAHTMSVSELEFVEEISDERFREVEEGLTEHMRRLANWLYKLLEESHEYLTSEEAIWNSLVSNDMVEDEDLLEVEADALSQDGCWPTHPLLCMAIDGKADVWRVEFKKDGSVSMMGFVAGKQNCLLENADHADGIPHWMKEKVAVLDMLDGGIPTHHVNGIGRRIKDNVYYLVK